MSSKERVPLTAITYEELADPKWKGKICIRSGQHPYNTSLIAAYIAHYGEANAEAWLRGVKANLARKATGGDREVARDILGGICDIGVGNSYYVGLMRSGTGGPDQLKWGAAINPLLPTFKGGGTHVNISGAAIAKHSPNKANAQKLLEYLVSNDAQALYAQLNYEYPVRSGAAVEPIIASFGALKPELARPRRHRQKSQTGEHPGRQGRLRSIAQGAPSDARARTHEPETMSVAHTSARRSDGRGWTLASLLVAAIVLAPIAALFAIAAQGSGDLWPHLLAYVLPQAVHDTALLLLGVGVVTVVVGVGTAWLVTTCRFPGRGLFDWALLLPLAVPTYIVAFAYLDILHPLGPIQTALRALLAIDDPRGLWLPDVRSLPGCILLLGFVLYPYVYLAARATFLMQSAPALEVARTLGAGRLSTFLRVALPLARPAIAVGATLALLEALNDIGASEFLGVRTFTVSIYATWVNRSSLPGAAQIALVMLAAVLALVLLERWGRRHRQFSGGSRRAHPPALAELSGLASLGAFAGLRCARADRIRPSGLVPGARSLGADRVRRPLFEHRDRGAE